MKSDIKMTSWRKFLNEKCEQERREGDPYFTWRDLVFGNNIASATVQILIGLIVFVALYFLLKLFTG